MRKRDLKRQRKEKVLEFKKKREENFIKNESVEINNGVLSATLYNRHFIYSGITSNYSNYSNLNYTLTTGII